MAVVKNDAAKNQIIKILRKQGYPTYARLVDYFDIYLTDNPNVIGYMVPGQAKIVLNSQLGISQVSTVVRHEILHEYLTHGPRTREFEKSHPELGSNHELSNIAADYEISNKGYTNADKLTIRHLALGDRILRGLVTEDDYPDWEYKTFEEMYTELLKQHQQDQQKLQDLIQRICDMTQTDPDDLSDDIQDTQDKAQSDSGKAKAGQLKKELDKIKDDVKDAQGGSGSEDKPDDKKQANKEDRGSKSGSRSDSNKGGSTEDSTPFDTPEEQKKKQDLANRIAKIKEILQDIKIQEQIQDETTSAVRKDRVAQAARDAERVTGSGIYQFKLNLNRFIASQIEEFEDDSYARVHPSYEDSEFILPGKMWKEEKHIPRINVYWDVSGSFNSAAKTAAARKAIESLNRYVTDGQIVIDVFYFAADVQSERSKCNTWGTNGKPILDHIEQTNPDNVIVITDGDISDCNRVVKVPGAVWMLFYDSRSQNLIDHLKGKRQTKYYDVKY